MYRPGLYTASVTPFTSENTIDLDAFRNIIQRQIDGGAQGVVLMGTTGECPTVSPQERDLLINEATNLSQGQILIISGCGSSCTRSTIDQAIAAEKSGSDAIQMAPPAYNSPSQEGIFRHFEAVHNATSIPIFIYNVPGRVRVNIEPKTIERLLHLERCVGIKEASGNLPQLMEVVEIISNLKKPVTLLCGDDLLAVPSILLGAHGVMSVISNLLPKTTNNLINNALEGRSREAKKDHYELRKIMHLCFLETNPVPIKYMLSRRGLCNEECRLPLTPLSKENKQQIDTYLNSISFEEL